MNYTSRRLLFIAIFIGLISYTVFLFYFISKDSAQSDVALFARDVTPSTLQEPVRQALPVRLKITSIGVNSLIENVGLTSGGAMDVPKDVDNIGWFNLGPRPGEIGTAVVDGHYGISKGKASAFDNLYKLRQGDKISVEDEKGGITIFVVRGNRRYDPKANATSVFSSSDGKSHLNLITCEGVWDEISKSYSQRLVVFADKE